MKVKIEIELGNAEMRTLGQVRDAIHDAMRPQILARLVKDVPARPVVGDTGKIRDIKGNTVGKWEVSES